MLPDEFLNGPGEGRSHSEGRQYPGLAYGLMPHFKIDGKNKRKKKKKIRKITPVLN
jgi:hypothetical protein